MSMAKLYLIFLLSFISTTAFCQSKDIAYKDSTTKYWITIGIWNQDKQMTFNLDYSLSIGDYFYKVGYLYNGEVVYL